MGLLDNIRIRFKLPAIMLVLMVLVVVVFAVISARLEKTALVKVTSERIASVLNGESRALQGSFDETAFELSLASRETATIRAIRGMTSAWNAFTGDPRAELTRIYVDENPFPAGKREEYATADDRSQYSVVHAIVHPMFLRRMRDFGYSDILLFDTAGNLIYSVKKDPDFGTNMLDGPYRDSGPAKAYRVAMAAEPEKQTFVDYALFAPAGGVPAAFLAVPVFFNGERIGVIAYQLSGNRIDRQMNAVTGLGDSGAIELVGPDHLLRSNRPGADFPTLARERALSASVDRALAGESGTLLTAAPDGSPILEAFQPVEILGETWAAIGSVSQEEALAAVAHLNQMLMWGGLATVAIGAFVAFFFSRSLALPLGRLTGSVTQIAEGDLETEVRDTRRSDEIGQIAGRLEEFRAKLKLAEEESLESAYRGAAFSASTAPIMILGPEGTVRQANLAIRKLFEENAASMRAANPAYDGGDIRGRGLEAVLPIAAVDRVRRLMANQTDMPAALGIPLGDGRLALAIDTVRSDTGENIGYVVELKDVTESYMSEAVLQSIDVYQLRAEFSRDGRVMRVNETFCRVFGEAREALVGRDIGQILEVENGEGIGSRLQRGDAVFGRFTRKGGAPDDCLIEGGLTPVSDDEGELLRYILIGTDVTEAQRSMTEAEAERTRHAAAQEQIVDSLRAGLGKLAEGDLGVRIDTAFAEAYEQLRTDFNAAVDRPSDAIRGVAANAEEIRGGASEISSAADDMSTRTERQAATLEETAAALDQLTASVREAAEGAAEANRIVESARGNAETSGEVVREAVGAMSELSESSKQISKITEVIDDIAYQTNLLALNAGVEAARAGEAGRGFAVVASEVRALAQRSSDAAREINDLISSSGRQVKRGVDLVGQAGEALKTIVTGVIDISHHVSRIAESSREQSSGLAEINAAVGQLDQVTQQNAAMFEEATAAGHSLTREAELLTQSMARFRTGDPGENSGRVVTSAVFRRTAPPEAQTAGHVSGQSGSAQTATAAAVEAFEDAGGWSEF